MTTDAQPLPLFVMGGIIGVVWLFFGGLAFWRARSDRMSRLKGDASVLLRDSGRKLRLRHRVRHVLNVVSLLWEFVQWIALSFIFDIPWTIDEAQDVMLRISFRFENEVYVGAFVLMAGGYLLLAIFLLATAPIDNKFMQWKTKTWAETLFWTPVVWLRDTIREHGGWVFLTMAFMPAMVLCFSMLRCDNRNDLDASASPFQTGVVLERYQDIRCWEGWHWPLAGTAVLVVVVLYPFNLIFNLSTGSPDDDSLRFLSSFSIFVVMMQLAVTAVTTLVTNSWVSASTVLGVTVLLWCCNFYLQPCLGGWMARWVNHWRSSMYGGAAWAAICSLIALGAGEDRESSAPFYTFVAGLGPVMVLLWWLNVWRNAHVTIPDEPTPVLLSAASSPEVRGGMLQALSHIKCDKVRANVADDATLQALIDIIATSDVDAATREGERVDALNGLANLASNSDNQKKVMRLKGLKPVFDVLRVHMSPEEAEAAAHVLANMAEGDPEAEYIVNHSKTVSILLKLSDPHVDPVQPPHVVRSCMRALANLCTVEVARSAVMRNGGVPIVVTHLDPAPGDTELLVNTCLVVTNMSVQESIAATFGVNGAPAKLVMLLNHEDAGVQEGAAEALSNLSVVPKNRREIVHQNAVPRLADLVARIQERAEKMDGSGDVEQGGDAGGGSGDAPASAAVKVKGAAMLRHAAGLLGALSADSQAQSAMSKSGVVHELLEMLGLRNEALQEQAATTLADMSFRVAARNQIVKEGGVEALLRCFAGTKNDRVRQECLRAVSMLLISKAGRAELARVNQAATVLVMGVRSDDPVVCMHAARVVSNGAASPAVRRMLTAESIEERLAAAIGEHGKSSETVEALRLAQRNLAKDGVRPGQADHGEMSVMAAD